MIAIAICLAGIVVFSGCDKNNGSNNDNNPTTDEILQLTFDKPEYYPFDLVFVQLPEAIAANQYNGSIGAHTITARYFSESTWVFAMPDLTTGEYTLSLQIENSKAEGKLKIIALPTVENPEAVIEEIKTAFTQFTEELTQTGDPNAPLVTNLADYFNKQLSQMTQTERQRFAAIWQMHPEFRELPDTDDLRSIGSKLSATLSIVTTFTRDLIIVSGCIYAFDHSLTSFMLAPNIISAAICSGAALVGYQHITKIKINIKRIFNQAFIPLEEISASLLKSASAYDFTLKNGETLAFNVKMTFRSITAKDIGSSLVPDVVSEIVEGANQFQSLWDMLANCINTLRSYIGFSDGMTDRPQTVSEITTPLAQEMETVEDWTLQIVSGNVSAQKTSNHSFTINTTAKENVEFRFKIVAEGIATREYSALLEVEEAPVITTTTLANGAIGTPYNAILTANGTTPLAWSIISGKLPDGLTLNAATGLISGTPSKNGNFTFTVKAANIAGEDTKEFTVTIAAVAPSITKYSFTDGMIGASYSEVLTATGTEPLIWSIASDVLPDGLTLNAETGVISGTPSKDGRFTFTVKVTNDAGENTRGFTINILKELEITTASILAVGMVGITYGIPYPGAGGIYENSFIRASASAGATPYEWSISDGILPDGLSLTSDHSYSVKISGIPTKVGDFWFTVKVKNRIGAECSKKFNIKINEYSPLVGRWWCVKGKQFYNNGDVDAWDATTMFSWGFAVDGSFSTSLSAGGGTYNNEWLFYSDLGINSENKNTTWSITWNSITSIILTRDTPEQYLVRRMLYLEKE